MPSNSAAHAPKEHAIKNDKITNKAILKISYLICGMGLSNNVTLSTRKTIQKGPEQFVVLPFQRMIQVFTF